MITLRRVSPRTLWRVLVFDVGAPLVAIGALLVIGVALRWPLWWVSACSVLVLLIVEGMLLNARQQRRDSVTVGTDDAQPGGRLAVVALATAALVAAAVVGYTQWTQPDRELNRDRAEVVRVASEVTELTATVSLSNPTEAVDRAATLVVPEHAPAFREKFGQAATEMANHNVSAQAQTLAGGVEAINPSAARVTMIVRSTRTGWDQEPKSMVVTARVKLIKQDGRWLVLDVSPIHVR